MVNEQSGYALDVCEAVKIYGTPPGGIRALSKTSIQSAYSGINCPNLYSKEVPMAPSAMPHRMFINDPVQARALDKKDIRDLRRLFINALKRSRAAGFDLVCLYGAHGFGILQHLLSRATNHRTDEYGGSLENRARFTYEVVEGAHNTISDTMDITLRLSLNELIGDLGFANSEVGDFIAMNMDLPDLWDLAHGAWEDCSGPSRFKEEAAQQELVRGIKELTSKPVVGAGRFTSPDVLVEQSTSGNLDFIACARPSIADPVMPMKIEEGRIEDILECIGCNIGITGDMTMSISRCTQNPTSMEEWRKGWYPECMQARGDSDNVLIVGTGPAGMAATRALALRGYDVALAERGTELGGRVARESQLPGLSAWGRVKDYREYQISQSPNVETYFDSVLSADDILEFGFQNVAIATGSTWRRDGVARQHVVPMPMESAMPAYTPDDLMGGNIPTGEVILYDDDHYYMGGVLAELLAGQGAKVTLITPSAYVSDWTRNTLEPEWPDARIRSIKVIGDAQAPCPIAWATYAGHRFARELDMPDIGDQLPFRRKITQHHLETT